MDDETQFALTTTLVGAVALAHALWTWPPVAVLALFAGGAAVAFVGELFVIHAGWLDHHVGPKVLEVPLYVLPGWTGTIYVAYRLALLGTEGWVAVALAAVLATGYDLFADPHGVADGFWTYTDDLPGPRWKGVPWWNFWGWFVISFLTAGLVELFG